jgi:MOSC domain-containing protein YiiM
MVQPGDLGENITTTGISLLALPTGTRLKLGSSAIVEVTGLRNPCVQIDRFQAGLLAAVVGRDASGAVQRKSGVMSVVVASGVVRPGDEIEIELPDEPHRPLEVV